MRQLCEACVRQCACRSGKHQWHVTLGQFDFVIPVMQAWGACVQYELWSHTAKEEGVSGVGV